MQGRNRVMGIAVFREFPGGGNTPRYIRGCSADNILLITYLQCDLVFVDTKRVVVCGTVRWLW